MEDITSKVTDLVMSKLTDTDSKLQFKKSMNKAKEIREEKTHLSFLKDEGSLDEINRLIKNKRLTRNQIKSKIKEFLNNPEDLVEFLNSYLEIVKPKKEESTEATGAGSAGGYSMPLFSTTKGDVVKGVKTVREGIEFGGGEMSKAETTEATSASSSGQYNQPAIWAKSLSKKDWKGASTKYMPGAKRVQVKKKCKKFPYCNQGDINALKIFESESVQNAIDSVSGILGLDKKHISEIVFKEIRKRQ
jgi:hypothetical protein